MHSSTHFGSSWRRVCLDSRPDRCTPAWKSRIIKRRGGWMSLRVPLGTLEKNESLVTGGNRITVPRTYTECFYWATIDSTKSHASCPYKEYVTSQFPEADPHTVLCCPQGHLKQDDVEGPSSSENLWAVYLWTRILLTRWHPELFIRGAGGALTLRLYII
jgi:hypothetical protein